MSIKQRLEQDLKTALLSGNKQLVTTLRGLKSAILYIEVGEGKRDTGLSDDEIITLFQKEAKKRQESVDLYTQGGNKEKADQEAEEKQIIESYLPAQLSDNEIDNVVRTVIEQLGAAAQLGPVIGKVKQQIGARADGSRIAQRVKVLLDGGVA